MARTRSMMAALAALAVTVTGVGVPVVAGTVTAAPAAAAVASEFSPGNIISDTLFFDGSAMTEGDVQSFLVAKRPTCTPGYTCLKDYVTATTNQPAEPGLCSAYTGRSAETAAQVIARVGQACGISQRVLLVLLQKEQGLVTSSAPGDSRYRSATGFGCPDGAPCDAQYYGFFNQVYRAARQFKRYAANPQSYSYRAGRVNTVKYHPSASCGTSQLYIENQATAGLYIYTPYRPNDSALANLYGTGDGCASYGNRNFWRDYTDWFGSTQNGADLVKTADDPTVWLLGVGTKHRVEDPVVLDSLAPLGAPAVVSRSVIDARPTGASLGRFFRGRDGSIWMFDKGWRFHATSCDLVADWGRTCDEYFSMQLTDRQLSRFVDGGPLSNSFSTAEGSWFVVDDGTRREVFDQASLEQGGVVTVNPRIHVREAAAAHLRVGAPVVRPGVLVRDRAGGDGMLVLPSGRWTVGRVLDSQTRLGQLLPTRMFDTASIAAAGSASGRFTGTLQAPDGTRVVTTISGTLRLPAGVLPALTGPAAPAEVVTALAPAEAGRVVFVRSVTDGSLFLADGAQRRAVTTLATMETLAAGERATVVMVEQSALDAIAVGTPVLTPGQVVKAQDGPELYLVDGPSTLRHVPTFATMTELGRSSWTTVTRAQLTGYTVGTPALSTVLSCGGTTYVGVGGSLRRLSAGAASAAGLPTLTV
ncbi:hypothetical protein J1G43_18460, partial [Cellulomonas sp. zg-ZUI22]|uniref:hypothetical protein n=2 Tax=Cellulomonas TaxID=1707 RepID=UPI001A948D77